MSEEDRLFREKNVRRLALIEQQYVGFTEEERRRPFAEYPDWEAECERRCAANLTAVEREELAALTAWVSEYLDRKFGKRG